MCGTAWRLDLHQSKFLETPCKLPLLIDTGCLNFDQHRATARVVDVDAGAGSTLRQTDRFHAEDNRTPPDPCQSAASCAQSSDSEAPGECIRTVSNAKKSIRKTMQGARPHRQIRNDVCRRSGNWLAAVAARGCDLLGEMGRGAKREDSAKPSRHYA